MRRLFAIIEIIMIDIIDIVCPDYNYFRPACCFRLPGSRILHASEFILN